ncbi:uncharacterized protein LOC119674538 isoform X2 [Teleopsis dalmanni]|uniref:uncharacterized protein LOC119674538 isoform X2 n=1 Tax=Teleopsis dalmanni TaxID=139649 RepID=UPI0018CE0CA7|nr:uncharacterized protein LOC119674538 isoform X2 [Teleopsis dalmanni]
MGFILPVITFSAGIYTGVYISQNYDVPRVDQPSKFIERIKEIANDHKKKTPAEQLMYDLKKEAKKVVQ